MGRGGELRRRGLRLDAVQTIKDDSPKHILTEIQERVQALARELKRTVNVIAETDENDSRYTRAPDRKSTRLNSSHRCISYAIFCFNKQWVSCNPLPPLPPVSLLLASALHPSPR